MLKPSDNDSGSQPKFRSKLLNGLKGWAAGLQKLCDFVLWD